MKHILETERLRGGAYGERGFELEIAERQTDGHVDRQIDR